MTLLATVIISFGAARYNTAAPSAVVAPVPEFDITAFFAEMHEMEAMSRVVAILQDAPRLDETTARVYARYLVNSAAVNGLAGTDGLLDGEMIEETMAQQVIVESWGTNTARGPRVCLARQIPGERASECTLWDQALGLGQIMPSVWNKPKHPACYVGEDDGLFDPETNLLCMGYVLKTYLDECEDNLKCGLNRYWGTTRYPGGATSPYHESLGSL